MFDSEKLVIIRPGIIILLLATIVFLLSAASVGSIITKFSGGHEKLFNIIRLFNMDYENNIPTFISTANLLIASLLLGIIAILKNHKEDSFSLHWKILSVLFFCFAVDEESSIHEIFIMPLRQFFHAQGIFYFTWTIIGIISVAIFAACYAKFFFHLTKRFRTLFAGAAICYLSGAIGLELLDGWYAATYGAKNLAYNLLTTAEESMEMVGVIWLIYGLLNYISINFYDVRICFKNSHLS
jgi:hypothetical protein